MSRSRAHRGASKAALLNRYEPVYQSSISYGPWEVVCPSSGPCIPQAAPSTEAFGTARAEALGTACTGGDFPAGRARAEQLRRTACEHVQPCAPPPPSAELELLSRGTRMRPTFHFYLLEGSKSSIAFFDTPSKLQPRLAEADADATRAQAAVAAAAGCWQTQQVQSCSASTSAAEQRCVFQWSMVY